MPSLDIIINAVNCSNHGNTSQISTSLAAIDVNGADDYRFVVGGGEIVTESYCEWLMNDNETVDILINAMILDYTPTSEEEPAHTNISINNCTFSVTNAENSSHPFYMPVEPRTFPSDTLTDAPRADAVTLLTSISYPIMIDFDTVQCPLGANDTVLFTTLFTSIYSELIAKSGRNTNIVPVLPVLGIDYSCEPLFVNRDTGLLKWMMHVSDEASFDFSKTQCETYLSSYNATAWGCISTSTCMLEDGTSPPKYKYEASHEDPLYFGNGAVTPHSLSTCNCSLVNSVPPTIKVLHQYVTVENIAVVDMKCTNPSRRRSLGDSILSFELLYSAYGLLPNETAAFVFNLLKAANGQTYSYEMSDGQLVSIVIYSEEGGSTVRVVPVNQGLSTVAAATTDDSTTYVLEIVLGTIAALILLAIIVVVVMKTTNRDTEYVQL